MNVLPASGPARRQQITWLGGLLVILLAVYWMQTAPAEQPGRSPGAVVNERPSPATPLPIPEGVRLAALEDVTVLAEAGRNPFGFGIRPLPPVPPPAPFAPAPMQAPTPALPPGPLGPPPIALKLAGMTVAVEGGRTMVTLRDPASNTIYLAYEGEVVDGRYRVVKVGVQSVVLSYVDGSGMRTIPLGG